MDREIVNIFWTGGYDSTFRVIQLSTLSVDIQPIYISDNRLSEENEINAIKKITQLLKSRVETKARFLELIYFKRNNIKKDLDISLAYDKLREKYGLGGQYEWLARYAAEQNIKIELGLEKEIGSHAYQCLVSLSLVEKQYKNGGRYKELPSKAICNDENIYSVFQYFRFPLPLFEMSKLEVLEWCKQNKYVDVIKHTWFCHSPIKNKPCGICNPCVQVVRSGMRFRLSKISFLRFKIFRTTKIGGFFLRVFKKINTAIKYRE